MELEDEAHVLVSEGRATGIAELHDICADLSLAFSRGDGKYHAAAIGLVERAHYLQEGRFACPACAYDTDYLASLYVKVDAFEHFKAAKTLLYVAYLNHFDMLRFESS